MSIVQISGIRGDMRGLRADFNGLRKEAREDRMQIGARSYHVMGRRAFEACWCLDLDAVVQRLNAQYAARGGRA